MNYWAQNNPAYGGNLLGENFDPHYTLSRFGCLVTVFSNIQLDQGHSFDPGKLNMFFTANGAFLTGGGTLIWAKVPELILPLIDTGIATTLAQVNAWLAADKQNYAAMEVRNSAGGQHYVTGLQVNTIIDSADGYIKNMLTYPFIRAHLYRWAAPGKGSAAAIAPIINPEEGKVYLSQEELDAKEADKQAWVTRATTAEAALAATVADGNAWKATAASLTEQLAATRSATVVSMSTTPSAKPTEALPTGITSETPNVVTRVAIADGEMVDVANLLGGGLPTLAVTRGMVFKQYSTFVNVGGHSYVRTQKSHDNGQYYGTPESLFDPLPVAAPTGSNAAQLELSKWFGAIGKWVYSLVKHK